MPRTSRIGVRSSGPQAGGNAVAPVGPGITSGAVDDPEVRDEDTAADGPSPHDEAASARTNTRTDTQRIASRIRLGGHRDGRPEILPRATYRAAGLLAAQEASLGDFLDNLVDVLLEEGPHRRIGIRIRLTERG